MKKRIIGLMALFLGQTIFTQKTDEVCLFSYLRNNRRMAYTWRIVMMYISEHCMFILVCQKQLIANNITTCRRLLIFKKMAGEMSHDNAYPNRDDYLWRIRPDSYRELSDPCPSGQAGIWLKKQ